MGFDFLWTKTLLLVWSWEEWKFFFERSISFSADALHVIGGVIILLAAALLLKRTVSSWLPWMIVFVLACLNEAADLGLAHWPHRGMQFGESARDLVLSMALPTILLVAARLAPNLWSPR